MEGSFEPQGPSEEELREQIKAEFAQEEQLRLELLEAERLENEAVVPQEVPGEYTTCQSWNGLVRLCVHSLTAILLLFLLELTDEERKSIVQSAEFVDFIDHSSKILERAMTEKYDFMKDYTLGLDDDT